MPLISQICTVALSDANHIAQCLRVIPEGNTRKELIALRKTLTDYVRRALRDPFSSVSTQRFRTYSPMIHEKLHEKITKIFHIIQKGRNASSNLSRLEPPQAGVSAPKTSRIQLPSGKVIYHVPYSQNSLIDNCTDELSLEPIPLLGSPFSSSVLESILACYKNYFFKQEENIPGNRSLAMIFTFNLALSDLIKMEILSAQSKGIGASKGISEGINNAIEILIESISQIDYLGDEEIPEVPCINKLLYDYSGLTAFELVCLYFKMKDFPTGLAGKVKIHVHAEILKRKKVDPLFQRKLNAFSSLAPEDKPSAERYFAELLAAPPKEYKRLLESELSTQIPTFILEFLMERSMESPDEIFRAVMNVTKKVSESFYLKNLRSKGGYKNASSLLLLACYHGKVGVAEEIITKYESLSPQHLYTAFSWGCTKGHILILELFRSKFPLFLGGEGIGGALRVSVKFNQEDAVDFLLYSGFFNTCPIATSGKSLATAAFIAAQDCHYSILAKLMDTPQFQQIPFINMVGILNALAKHSQLSLVLKIMNSEHFKYSLPQDYRLYLGEHCGTTTGAFLYGCAYGWDPLIKGIIESPAFEEISPTGPFGIGKGLIVANANRSLATFYALLESPRAYEIPFDGEYSISNILDDAMADGNLPESLAILSHPIYQKRLNPLQRGVLYQEHGAVKLCLSVATIENSENLVEAIIESNQFDFIPLEGPFSLTASIEQSLKSGNETIACSILFSRRSGELSSGYINKLWNDAIRSRLFPLAIAILQGPAESHIPLATLKETLNFTIEQGQLPLFLALQENPRLQSTFAEEETTLLRQEHGGITRALHISVSTGKLSLLRAILDSPSFVYIYAFGPNSLNEAFDLALEKTELSLLQAFLGCSRENEIAPLLKNCARVLIENEAAAPKNPVFRFFWNLTH